MVQCCRLDLPGLSLWIKQKKGETCNAYNGGLIDEEAPDLNVS